ncbi:hypothetical protein [Vibrio campbellii]|uniref:hypothetical protein n=1 Tax=Vibrio campbellii TaxID=680 RepID=UPI0005EE6B95|nr:hypothetical protein [Vibrio campbellii]
MNNQQIYSSLFSTIYDQPESSSNFGGGVHYSVLRAVEWLNVERQPLSKAEIHDFAIIWDADHDTRVIQFIERLYVEGLLSPIQFIGEYKGTVTIILAAKYEFGLDNTKEYKRKVSEIATNLKFDSWNCNFGMFDRAGPEHQCDFSELIGVDHKSTFIYLRSIDLQWKLGTYAPELKSI